MLFTLEALRAGRGDCLLLHSGDRVSPRLALIDGGPAGVFERSLLPRLEELRYQVSEGSLRIPLMMVSHVDREHLDGLVDLTRHLAAQRAEGLTPDCRVDLLWLNLFENLLGEEGAERLARALDGHRDLGRRARLLLDGTSRARELKMNARRLSIPVNSPFAGVVTAGSGARPIMVGRMKITVLGPSERKLSGLRRAGMETVERFCEEALGLASIVVLAELSGKKMLLTGDARGEDVIEGARNAGFLDDGGRLEVDLLKVPHHGSFRGAEADFFAAFPADNYVFSGRGPDLETFETLFAARREDERPFRIFLNYRPEEFAPVEGKAYPVEALRHLMEDQRKTREFIVVEPQDEGQRSVKVDLLDPMDL